MVWRRWNWPLMVLLVAWLPVAVSLWPFPSREAASDLSSALYSAASDHGVAAQSLSQLNEDALFLRWQRRWALRALALVTGLVSVMLALRQSRGWRLALPAASAAYLLLISGLPVAEVLRPQQWQIWWLLLTELWPFGPLSVYLEVAFPLLHAVLLVVLTASLIREKSKRT